MKNLAILFIALLLLQLSGCKNESEQDVIKENNLSKDDNPLRDITIDDVVNVPPDFQTQYEIIKIEDISSSGVDRRRMKISIPSGLSKKGLVQNIYHSIKTIYNTYHSDGISIRIYVRDKDGQIGNYLGSAEFAPYGDWGKVDSNLPLEEYLVRLDIQHWYYKSEGKTSKKTGLPVYTIIDQDVYDAPIKTQVVRYILVSGSIDKIYLRNLLESQYVILMKKDDFKYHKNPTHVFVYLYDQEDNAKSSQGQWIAMLQKNPYDQIYNITIREDLIKLRDEQKPQVKRFGLSERERRRIYKEYISTESRSMYDALSKEPDNFKKQVKLGDELMGEYKNQLAKKYNLTRNQLEKIGNEGFENNWSMY